MSFLTEVLAEKVSDVEVLEPLQENCLGEYNHLLDMRSWSTPTASTSLSTWSASTSRGKDNDKDDKGGKD